MAFQSQTLKLLSFTNNSCRIRSTAVGHVGQNSSRRTDLDAVLFKWKGHKSDLAERLEKRGKGRQFLFKPIFKQMGLTRKIVWVRSKNIIRNLIFNEIPIFWPWTNPWKDKKFNISENHITLKTLYFPILVLLKCQKKQKRRRKYSLKRETR